MRHVIVIETAENPHVPESNPTTDDLCRYLAAAIACRQGDIKPEAAHTWWMRAADVRPLDTPVVRAWQERDLRPSG